MRRIAALAMTVVALAVAAESRLDAQKKDKKDKAPAKASDAEYAELAKYPEMTGKLLTIDDKGVTVRNDFPTWVPNPSFKPGSLKLPGHLEFRKNQLLREQQDALRVKNLADRQRRLLHVQREMEKLNVDIAKHFSSDKTIKNGPYKLVTATRDFDLTFEEKVVVRTNIAPTSDATGKAYSKDDLEKLKSKDPKTPGYPAKLGDVVAGQSVKLFLKAPPKKTTDKATDKKDTTTDKTTDKAPDKTATDDVAPRPTVRLILILEDMPATSDPKTK
ncbi:MAG: hypothetical protein U0793_12560 [Gemmataceae bacterium]